MEKEPQKKISFSLNQNLYNELKGLAKENCYTLPGYIRQILKQHIQQQGKEAP